MFPVCHVSSTYNLELKRAGDVYETFAGSKPRYAVCYMVLNLHLQVGGLADTSVLALAYHISTGCSPQYLGVGSK